MGGVLAEPLEDSFRGAFAFGGGVDHFAAAVDTIATGEVFGIVGLAGFGIDDDLAVVEFDGSDLFESFEKAGLADGDDDGLGRNDSAVITLDCMGRDVDGAGIPNEVDAGLASVFVFEGEGGHVGFGAAVEDGDVRGSEVFGSHGSVYGGVASADDGHFVTDMHGFGVLVSSDKFQSVDDVAGVFAGNAERLRAAETNADEDGVEFALEIFDSKIFTDSDTGLEFDAGGADEFDFASRVGRSEFVLSDTIRIEAAGLRTFVKDGDIEAVFTEFGGTGKRGRAGADTGDFLRLGNGFVWELAGGRIKMLHGVTLEKADGDGLMVDVVIDAGTFAEDLNGADARATQAQNIGVENCFGGTEEVAGGDFLDETRDIYMRGAGAGARRIKAEQAAVGFGYGCLRAERRMEFGEGGICGHQLSVLKAQSRRLMNSSTSGF